MLEREPLERLAAAGRLGAYRHDGFWDCMDTYKDAVTLNDLGPAGRPLDDLGSRGDRRLMVALVTGGRGFVGAWLAKALLERGDTVVSFDRGARRSGPRRSGCWELNRT